MIQSYLIVYKYFNHLRHSFYDRLTEKKLSEKSEQILFLCLSYKRESFKTTLSNLIIQITKYQVKLTESCNLVKIVVLSFQFKLNQAHSRLCEQLCELFGPLTNRHP